MVNLSRALGLAMLTTGAAGLTASLVEGNQLAREYFSKVEDFPEGGELEQTYEPANEYVNLSRKTPELGDYFSFVFISGGALLASGSNKKRESSSSYRESP